MAHLYRGGRVLGSEACTALLIVEGTIAWVGDDEAAAALTLSGMSITELEGALVTPGFVDAHVHSTSTGLTMLGLDLSATNSAREVLEAVEHAATSHQGALILGHGWDESRWSDRSLPTASGLDRAASGRRVYLTRADAHSALVSSALIDSVPGVRELPGFDESGWVTQEAHHELREVALGQIDDVTRARAQEAFLDRAASCGIVSVHEMAGPVVSSEQDCQQLLTRSARRGGVQVFAYWGQLAQEGGIECARDLGAHGAGGDLFVDGSLGSHTACIHRPYDDLPISHGREFIDRTSLVEHVDLCVRAQRQTGFHAIGDAATEAVTAAYSHAAGIHGVSTLKGQRHRIEHAELMSLTDISECARLGIIASMQPVFDHRWGGDEGMYATRLGVDRAGLLNPIADLTRSGVSVAFGSDAPVTPLDPWGAIHAALGHRTKAQRILFDAALDAHTRAGWHAAGVDNSGRVEVGAPAHLAFWQSSAPGEIPQPGATSLRTVMGGEISWDSGKLEDAAC